MKKYRFLFCDLDGTLIQTVTGKKLPQGVWDMQLRFDVLDAIKKLAPERVYIVSNQGGIEKGIVSRMHFNSKLVYIRKCIQEYCMVNYVRSYYCSTNDRASRLRKPNPGMLEFYYALDSFDKGDALMIGDASGKENQFSDTDKKTAVKFGIDYMDVTDFVHCVQYKTS